MACGLPSIFTRGGYLDAVGTRASGTVVDVGENASAQACA